MLSRDEVARLLNATIQALLGHAKAFHTRVATRLARGVTSSLDKLGSFKVEGTACG